MDPQLQSNVAYTPIKIKSPINFQMMKEKLRLQQEQAKKKLYLVAFVSVFFIVAQLIGGYMAQSIAIFTDSAHLASDLVGFAISIFSLIIAAKPATKSLSFGYHRAEVVGTLVSIIFIWGLTLWLIQEATWRIFYPKEVLGGTMLIVAIMGLIFNLIQMKILHSGEGHHHLGGDHHHDHGHGNIDHDHSHQNSPPKKKNYGGLVQNQELMEGLIDKQGSHQHQNIIMSHQTQEKSIYQDAPRWNINVTSAYLHVLGDLLMSVGVIIAAVIIYIKPEFKIVDPLCTYLFSVIICFTTIPIFKECMFVLLEGSPKAIDTQKLEEDLLMLEGVQEVHDFHVWAMSVNKFALSAHLLSDTPSKTLDLATDLCRRKYKIFHTTLQIECADMKNKHQFVCENDLHE